MWAVLRTRIKFCGITRPQDAVAAAAAAADAIGLIFYHKSSRCVTMDQAREILRALPPMVSPVALFVNAEVDEILHTSQSLNIRTIQLHGDEPPEMLEHLAGFTVIKAVKASPVNLRALMDVWRDAGERWKNLSGFLLETAGTSAPGGTGVENDWAGLEPIIRAKESPPLIAAGGLTPEKVGDVVRRLRPFAVDVSTGIEERPGVKSADKMRRFALQVRLADESAS